MGKSTQKYLKSKKSSQKFDWLLNFQVEFRSFSLSYSLNSEIQIVFSYLSVKI